MFVQHKITKQIVQTDKPEDYLGKGWEQLPDEAVNGVFGNFAKTQLMQVSGEQRELPKSVIVEQLPTNRALVDVNFTDNLI